MRKIISVILCFAMFAGLPALARPQQSKEEKLKSQVTSLGVNKAVSVTLSSGELVNGRITEIKDTAFVLEISQDGKPASRNLTYQEVSKLSAKETLKAGKMPGRVSIGLIIGLGVAAVVAATAYLKNDRGK